MTFLLAVLGALAVLALAAALWPPREVPVLLELERLDRRRARSAAAGRPGREHLDAGTLGSWSLRWRGFRERAADVGHRAGVRARVNAADLLMSGRDIDAVLSAKIIACLATVVVGALGLIATARAMDVGVPFAGLLVTVGGLSFGAYLLPDTLVRREAAARRREFLAVLPVWCDLVALEMAGSAAAQEALVTAAEVGTAWPMQVLRDTLYHAARAHQSHWQALADLGDRTGIRELGELGRLSELVSHEGAEVRDTLIERAASIRRRALAEALGQAGERDESMRLAVLIIAAGIVLILTWPGAIAVIRL